MKNHTSRAILTALLLCAAAGTGLVGGQFTALAADNVSRSITPQIVDAQKSIQSKDFQGALDKLKSVQSTGDLKPYDNFVIDVLMAEAEQGLNDQKAASADELAAADSQGAPDEQKKSVLHNAVVASAVLQLWPKAIQYGQQLAQLNGLDAQTTGILAFSYYETSDFANAQKYAQQSISLAKGAGTPPDPNALKIIMSSQVKQNNQAGAEQTLEQIAMQNNAPDVWAQLAGAAMGAPGMGNQEALYLFRFLQFVGAMKGEDCKEMASDASVLGYPTEAMHVLDQCISAGKISAADAPELSKARRDAATDERSLPQIAASAEKSRTGEQEVKLGEDYWGYGRYADAEAAARQAMAKGGLKTPWEGPMLLGATQVAQGKYADAIQALSQVTGSQAVTRTAHLWSIYAQAKQGTARASAAPAAQAPSQ